MAALLPFRGREAVDVLPLPQPALLYLLLRQILRNFKFRVFRRQMQDILGLVLDPAAVLTLTSLGVAWGVQRQLFRVYTVSI